MYSTPPWRFVDNFILLVMLSRMQRHDTISRLSVLMLVEKQAFESRVLAANLGVSENF